MALLGGFAFATVTFAQVATQVALPVTFTIDAKVEVATDRVMLSDIAKCSGAKIICEEVYAVDLGIAPVPGKIEYFSKHEIAKILAKEWPHAAIEIASSETISITSRAAKITKETIQEALIQYLNDHFSDEDGIRLVANKLQITSNPIVRVGKFSINFPIFEQILQEGWIDLIAKKFEGRQNIDVIYGSIEENYSKKITVSANISISRLLPVAAHNLLKGRILESKDIMQNWVDIGRGHNRYITTRQDLIGFETKRNLAVGEAVLSNQVARPIVVKRGQLVNLHMNNNGVIVTGQIRALEKGGYGQIISAEYLNTKKKIRVKIRDSKNVEYKF